MDLHPFPVRGPQQIQKYAKSKQMYCLISYGFTRQRERSDFLKNPP